MRLQSVQDLRVGGRSSHAQYQYALEDADLGELDTWAPKVIAALEKISELKDVELRPADAGPRARLEDRSRHRVATRLSVAASTTRSTTRSASARSRCSTPRSTSIAWCSRPTVDRYRSRRARSGLRARRERLAGAAVGRSSKITRTRSRCRSATRGSSRRPRLVQPRAGHPLGDAVNAVEAATAKIGMPASDARHVQRHRAGVPGLAQERARARADRDLLRLHRARHPLRELHPSDHDPVDAAVGGPGRAARASWSRTPSCR